MLFTWGPHMVYHGDPIYILYLHDQIWLAGEVRRRAGIEMELASRADQRVLRFFGHVERMDEYRMGVDGG